jgi:polar amino acid transport system substrate-binding protein
MKSLWFVLIILAVASPVLAEDVIKFAYAQDAKPFSWNEDGKMQGIFIDVVNETIQNRMGLSATHQGHPWKRSQHLVRSGKADALVTNGPMRNSWAKHSTEVVVTIKHVLFVKANGPKFDQLKKVHAIEDLKPFKLVDERGSSWAQKNLEEKGIDVHWVADKNTMYRMVAKGRVDAVAYEPFTARFHIKTLGLQGQLIELPLETRELPFHIVIGNSSPHVKLLPKIDDVLLQMKQDGTMQRIYDKYR